MPRGLLPVTVREEILKRHNAGASLQEISDAVGFKDRAIERFLSNPEGYGKKRGSEPVKQTTIAVAPVEKKKPKGKVTVIVGDAETITGMLGELWS